MRITAKKNIELKQASNIAQREKVLKADLLRCGVSGFSWRRVFTVLGLEKL